MRVPILPIEEGFLWEFLHPYKKKKMEKMSQETFFATTELLDVITQLLDESSPDALLPKMITVASQMLHADAAVLEISGDSTLHLSVPASVSISASAVR